MDVGAFAFIGEPCHFFLLRGRLCFVPVRREVKDEIDVFQKHVPA